MFIDPLVGEDWGVLRVWQGGWEEGWRENYDWNVKQNFKKIKMFEKFIKIVNTSVDGAAGRSAFHSAQLPHG